MTRNAGRSHGRRSHRRRAICATARIRTSGRRGSRPPGGTRQPWEVHQGKELSYTNLLDLDAALRIVLEFTEPGAVVIKHTNPCGVATGDAIEDAYVGAREADPLSAFGGIVGAQPRHRCGDRERAHRRRSSRR